ncbi:hypothetical protein PO587_27105 [Streptomyces gilvifuscus]|uniref:Uncharacterized protein n=1 Tax=Streptomyces gilvifuscus TaxID=1550617 RepID=A0ABT5G075_9ACTN|nr:hypothetical protein [Streptomyces gilvifuscus]MDC2958122.1 hypothetical protein [Streptomyces gilvifuscus]
MGERQTAVRGDGPSTPSTAQRRRGGRVLPSRMTVRHTSIWAAIDAGS